MTGSMMTAAICPGWSSRQLLERVDVVPADDEVFVRRPVQTLRAGKGGTVRSARQFLKRRVITVKERVAPAVIVPLELDDLGTARERAGQPHGGDVGLGPRIGEPHEFHVRERAFGFFRQR